MLHAVVIDDDTLVVSRNNISLLFHKHEVVAAKVKLQYYRLDMYSSTKSMVVVDNWIGSACATKPRIFFSQLRRKI